MANLLTPNIPEAEVLSGMEIHNPGDYMETAARAIGEGYGCAVLKGGHQLNDAKRFAVPGQEAEMV